MIPGPTLIIPCPYCGHPGKKRTIISGNTFGAELWSDGKQIAPMLPEYPWLVKCRKCGKFFHTEEKLATRKLEWDDEAKAFFDDVEFFEFPSFIEYLEALGTEEDEKLLRVLILRSFNDYHRNNKQDEITDEMQMYDEDNLKSLLFMLDENDPDELILMIEINRELGKFDECLKLLNKVDDEKYGWLKETFNAEIERKNTKVFRLT
ncbi:MAG: hypothetical protein JXB49_26570 [Bacteroidales bacterium]|nr:hypothetical protein [Bacteroidales bacterium]